LTGGAGDDEIEGLYGADSLAGGAGSNRFDYTGVSESRSTSHDTIAGFDANSDVFSIPVLVKAVDAEITTGQLREAHFDADLAAVLDADTLRANHAVLFTPDSGDDAGKTYLIVDTGHAGYQGAHDYIIEIDNGVHLAALDTGNFI